MKLTFGFPTTSDPNAWMTLNAFKLSHRQLRTKFDVEIVIVDNSNPDCEISKEFQKHVKANHPDVKYVRDTGPPSSCLYKSRVFENATGDVVICVDSHVMLDEGCAEAVMEYYRKNPKSLDLLTGPCMNSADRLVATNQQLFADEPYKLPNDAVVKYGYVCRGGQLGVWVTDPRGVDPAGEPFQIRMNGTGFLAMRREAYPGFPDGLWGFGGCEPALFRRVEAAGGRVLCHPACRWVHNFCTKHGRGYNAYGTDKIRNYITSADATNDPNLKMAALEHFATVHPDAIGPAIVEAAQVAAGTFTPRPPKPEQACDREGGCAKKQHKPAKAAEAKVEEPPQAKAGAYERYLATWKTVGGDVGGAAPRPLFTQIVHFQNKVVNEKGEERRVRTLEFGSGLSTLGFDKQGTDHTAIEHDPKWIERVKSLIKNEDTKVIHAPIKDGWYDWKPELGALYDIILIDGPPGKIGRSKCIEIVPQILSPGGLVLIDDTHREEEQKISEELSAALGMVINRRSHGERKFDVLTAPPEPLGEGPGTELVRIFESMNMPACQQCHALARKMNEWGPQGCWDKMDYIVKDMLPRARNWWQASTPWMKADAWFKSQGSMIERLGKLMQGSRRMMKGADVDDILKESIAVHVSEAIRRYNEKQKATPTAE